MCVVVLYLHCLLRPISCVHNTEQSVTGWHWPQLPSPIYRWDNQTLCSDGSSFGDRKMFVSFLHLVMERLIPSGQDRGALTEVCCAVSTEHKSSGRV